MRGVICCRDAIQSISMLTMTLCVCLSQVTYAKSTTIHQTFFSTSWIVIRLPSKVQVWIIGSVVFFDHWFAVPSTPSPTPPPNWFSKGRNLTTSCYETNFVSLKYLSECVINKLCLLTCKAVHDLVPQGDRWSSQRLNGHFLVPLTKTMLRDRGFCRRSTCPDISFCR